MNATLYADTAEQARESIVAEIKRRVDLEIATQPANQSQRLKLVRTGRIDALATLETFLRQMTIKPVADCDLDEARAISPGYCVNTLRS